MAPQTGLKLKDPRRSERQRRRAANDAVEISRQASVGIPSAAGPGQPRFGPRVARERTPTVLVPVAYFPPARLIGTRGGKSNPRARADASSARVVGWSRVRCTWLAPVHT
jgi:hypothetical protein